MSYIQGLPEEDLRCLIADPQTAIWTHAEALRELGKRSLAMGYGWSYTEYLNGQTQQSEVEAAKPKGKECRCDSHYLFAFGHEKQCDYYEEKK